MKIRTFAMTAALAIAALPAAAQTPAAPAAPAASVVVANPTYTTIPLEIAVDRPAAEVWKRIGGYCAIAEWLQIPAGCKMLSGVEGEVGSVRSVANEVLVGKTFTLFGATEPAAKGVVVTRQVYRDKTWKTTGDRKSTRLNSSH